MPNHTKHGMSGTGDYQRWIAIKERCHNQNCPNFKRYGARGITICERWLASFNNYYADVGPCPAGRSLDRVDNNGGYWCGKCDECQRNSWPANWRWATRKEQMQNTRVSKFVSYQGETLTVSEWARRYNVGNSLLWRRLFVSKWPMERALTESSDSNAEYVTRRDQVRITVNGTSYTAKEWSRLSGIPYGTVYRRAKQQVLP